MQADYLYLTLRHLLEKNSMKSLLPNQYVITSELQMIEFLCATKVTRIQAEKEWCYIGCWKLSKKLQREISSFTCIVFDKTNDVGVLRYRVELSVSDKADDAVCLAWNAQIPTTVTYLFKSLLHLLINFCFSYSFYLS
ncbi:BnaA02g19210D [Brassica napus]|uniref:BnaA02g19210D protein n=1 Tax=Brassica napus TaxID=3708 RepID=A0A078IIE8_BRANA|nr:BnaA02g19210D [Brassica napus]